MSKHRKSRTPPPKRPGPGPGERIIQRPGPGPGERIIPARTAELLWRVAHAARAISWAPEMEDCGAAAYDALDGAVDALDAHVRSGGA